MANPNIRAWQEQGRRGVRHTDSSAVRHIPAGPGLVRVHPDDLPLLHARGDAEDAMYDRLEASEPSRRERAYKTQDRVHRQGAEALSAAGMPARVHDPSFGDDARTIRHTMPNGYHVDIAGPRPGLADPDYGGSHRWEATINPPQNDHRVGGEELHSTTLGTFHPRELPQRVRQYVGSPEVQRALRSDAGDPIKHLEREQGNARRGAFMTAFDVGGPSGLMEHVHRTNPNLGQQFG